MLAERDCRFVNGAPRPPQPRDVEPLGIAPGEEACRRYRRTVFETRAHWGRGASCMIEILAIVLAILLAPFVVTGLIIEALVLCIRVSEWVYE